jgi:hypothetical protein
MGLVRYDTAADAKATAAAVRPILRAHRRKGEVVEHFVIKALGVDQQ